MRSQLREACRLMRVKAPFRVRVGYCCKRSDEFVRVTWILESLRGTHGSLWLGTSYYGRPKWHYEGRIWEGSKPRSK
jgi:hypothetical protein